MVRGTARGGKGTLWLTNAWPWGHVPPKSPHLDSPPQPPLLAPPPGQKPPITPPGTPPPKPPPPPPKGAMSMNVTSWRRSVLP